MTEQQIGNTRGGLPFIREAGPNEMSAYFSIQRAMADEAPMVAVMVGELLTEIMKATGVQTFNFKREGFAISGGLKLKFTL